MTHNEVPHHLTKQLQGPAGNRVSVFPSFRLPRLITNTISNRICCSAIPESLAQVCSSRSRIDEIR